MAVQAVIAEESRQVLEEQQANQWPGLSSEVTSICEEIDIPDINYNDIPADHIKKAILKHHDEQMIDEVSNLKKMKKHRNDDFSQPQNYMLGKVVTNCRMAFRIR